MEDWNKNFSECKLYIKNIFKRYPCMIILISDYFDCSKINIYNSERIEPVVKYEIYEYKNNSIIYKYSEYEIIKLRHSNSILLEYTYYFLLINYFYQKGSNVINILDIEIEMPSVNIQTEFINYCKERKLDLYKLNYNEQTFIEKIFTFILNI